MLKIKSKELLYTRKDPAASFEAHISCWMLIEEKTTEGFIFIDSTTLNIVDANPDQTSRLVVSSSQFQLPLSSNPYRLTLKLKDKNRRWEQTEYLYTSKDEVPSRDDFQLYTNGSDLSVFGNKVHTGDFLKIKSDRFQQNWKHISWDDKTRLPAPPYTETRFELPFPEDTTKLVWDEGSVGKEISEGRLSLFDDRSQHVLTLLVTNDYFPEVRMIDEMIQSLRYISSKREFERINATKANRKKELDKFWLDCGGSKERSRELIRIYYRRVEEANYYFSSYVEGWKSDRGLIHIVFGNPNRINHGADYETWTYGEENNLSSVTFNFRKVDNALSENHLVLERNPIFRTQWDRAITAWRNGRIFQE
ncbi:MAG: GWxTD domain-containing protein [Flavobacteriales bacterium]|jgi:GWxTD domain-containing protein